jgi:hypothetical protein
MCREPLCQDDPAARAAQAAQAQSFENPEQDPPITLEEMNFTQDEARMHNDIMVSADINASEYCVAHPMCTYMGSVNLRTIAPNLDNEYHITEFGMHNVNCHYVIEMHNASRAFRYNASRAFRYKFGRIEDIRMPHPMFQGMTWFVFRELIEISDDAAGCVHTAWSHETHLIPMHARDVKSLRQYVPRMRVSV